MVFAIAYWLFLLAREYFTDQAERARFNKEIVTNPARMLFVALGPILFLMTMVGLMVPPFGALLVSVGSYTLKVWAVGLAGMFAWFALGRLNRWL